MFGLAKLIVPDSNETKEIDVVQTWEVRWQSADIEQCGLVDLRPEMEVFTSEAEASAFLDSIRKALQLTRIEGLHYDIQKRPLIR